MDIKTLDDINKLIVSDGETDSVEYKETTGQLERGMETLCAFLNKDGGTVLFGINDKKKVIGQEVADTARGRLKTKPTVLLQGASLHAGGKRNVHYAAKQIQ